MTDGLIILLVITLIWIGVGIMYMLSRLAPAINDLLKESDVALTDKVSACFLGLAIVGAFSLSYFLYIV